ncbi:hypothetical protein LZP96_07285 [Enterobacteriaceae bacterium 155047]|nr:hypothetical protein [Huaxiibacter chinensis]MCG5043846.1 hypothetical protein [Huaxiibacter chinensis]
MAWAIAFAAMSSFMPAWWSMMFASTGAEASASAPAILPPASPWRAAVAAWMPRCMSLPVPNSAIFSL